MPLKNAVGENYCPLDNLCSHWSSRDEQEDVGRVGGDVWREMDGSSHSTNGNPESQ